MANRAENEIFPPLMEDTSIVSGLGEDGMLNDVWSEPSFSASVKRRVG
jgi:hypothetical protein